MANLIVATTNNNEPMNQAVTAVARSHIAGAKEITEGLLNHIEVAIRAYDPCLSCATHAVGQMPLTAALYDADGHRDRARDQGVSRRGLVLGYGNPGRGDDGVAVRLVEICWSGAPEGVDVEAAFQPGIEHAAAVAEHDWVLFVDAAAEGPAPCEVRRVEPLPEAAFSTHVVDLGSILAIAAESFGSRTPAWLLAVRGYDFGMAEVLSRRAARNLDASPLRAPVSTSSGCSGTKEMRDGDNREHDDPDHR